jgi:polysaccharide export outer membrane protein
MMCRIIKDMSMKRFKAGFWIFVLLLAVQLVGGAGYASAEVFGASYFSSRGSTDIRDFAISEVISPEYQLGPGDEVVIRMMGASNEEFRTNVSIRGTLSIPRMAPIFVMGMPLMEAEVLVREKLEDTYKNVHIEMDIASLRTFNVYVTGEVQTPGSYTVTGTSTLIDLMYMCGGPTSNGSYRNIIVNRISKEQIGTAENYPIRLKERTIVDLYDYFIGGDQGVDLLLEPGDSIIVPPAGSMVSIVGAVKRPYEYEMKGLMNLLALVELCGGFQPDALQKRIQVRRKDENSQVVNLEVDFSTEEGKEFLLQDGDNVLVLNPNTEVSFLAEQGMYLPVARVEGEVNAPGAYLFSEGETIFNLILKAKGLTANAFRHQAELVRMDEEGNLSHQTINLYGILESATSEFNLPLQDGDVLTILHSSALDSVWYAQVSGEVNQPITCQIVKGMRVKDLIMKAQGVKNQAYLLYAELTRYKDGKIKEVIPVNLDSLLYSDSSESNILLENYDHLRVYADPHKHHSIEVNIQGEVVLPGTFSLTPDTRLSDALNQCGGIRPDGYKEGIILVRPSLRNLESDILDELQRSQEKDFLDYQAALVESAVTDTEKQLQLKALELRRKIISLIGERRIPGRFIFDPAQDDPILQDGDMITIPTRPHSVLVVGAVYGSGSVIFREGASAEDYLDNVGGLMPTADADRVYIIKPNGFVEQMSNAKSPIIPGDVIVVPPRVESLITSASNVPAAQESMSNDE